jgi:hypothetical protein
MRQVSVCRVIFGLGMLMACAVAAEETQAGRLTISSKKTGNVFFEGEKVSFMITAENLPSESELRIESVDFDGKVVATAKKSRYGGGRAVAEVGFGVQGVGYYLIRAEVVDGGQAISRAESSYAVVVGPDKRKYREDSPFAIDVAASWFFKNEKDLKAASELVRLAGISCVRDRFRWSGIERQKGTCRWGWYETSATVQHEAGLMVYQIFHDCPTWASGKGNVHYAPTNPADMGDFFRNMVGHFKDRVKYWEIWNEPDIKMFYLGTPEEYAAALKATYPEIKKADAEAKVLLCSFALAPGEFAQKIFQAGIADSFDIYNVHYYGDPKGVVYRLRFHKKLMEKYAIRKPVWVTEMGAVHPVAKKGDFETLRPEAAYLVKAYVYGLANGVERFFYFIFSDYDERGNNFGTVNRDFTPRPAYVALCNLTYLLGEGKFVREEKASGEGVECFVFQDGEREVAVLWAEKPQDARFKLNAAEAEAFDVIGRRIPCSRFSDGRFEVAVGPDPVFLKAMP